VRRLSEATVHEKGGPHRWLARGDPISRPLAELYDPANPPNVELGARSANALDRRTTPPAGAARAYATILSRSGPRAA
jgi:hypothetical protein